MAAGESMAQRMVWVDLEVRVRPGRGGCGEASADSRVGPRDSPCPGKQQGSGCQVRQVSMAPGAPSQEFLPGSGTVPWTVGFLSIWVEPSMCLSSLFPSLDLHPEVNLC